MIIRSIKLNNFGIYAGEQELYPAQSITRQDKPVTLIGGYNGRGKTSLLEAVLLALYGKNSPVVRDRKQAYSTYLESLIHNQAPADEKSWVELTFDITEEEPVSSITLHRSWHMANVRTVEKLKVFRNGVEDAYLADNWDTYVEDLVPSAIAELFFFDGERISTLAETEETIAPLQRAIRTMLGLEVVDRLIKDLNLVKRKNQKLIEDKDLKKEFSTLQEEQDLYQIELDQKAQEIASLNNQMTQAAKLMEQLEQEYLKTGAGILEGRDQLLHRIDEGKRKLSELKGELGVLAGGALPLTLVQPQLKSILSVVRKQEKFTQAKQALSLIQESDSELLEELIQSVPDSDLVEKVRFLLDKRKQKVVSMSNQVPTYPVSQVGAVQLESLMTTIIEGQQNYAGNVIERYEMIEHEIELNERHLAVDIDQDEASKILEQLKRARLMIVELEQSKARLEKERDSINFKLKQVEQRLSKLGSRISDETEAKRIIQYATKAQEKMVVFREHLAARKIESFAEHIFEAFDQLTHKTTLVKKIKVDPNSLRISLLSENDREMLKTKLSSGERQMLAVAIMWGLARASNRTLPVIIDTPMGRLDSMHRMNFITKYLPNASHQVMVLSTDTEIIGEYLESLEPSIGQMYHLKYNEDERSTSITEGYFVTVGGKT